jgi:glucose/arabinose dehydrogenase
LEARLHAAVSYHARAWVRGAALGAALACACTDSDGGAPPAADRYRLAPAFGDRTFARPVCMVEMPDASRRLCVVEQAGRIRVFAADSAATPAALFLDIEPLVRSAHNEEGLLAMAFHPRFATNGYFYVYHSASNPLRNVLVRYHRGSGGVEPGSRQVLLEIPKPFGNHNGATLVFGPDGFLYVSIGDGGSAGDPHGNAQNRATLLGKILRLDVDRQDPGLAYAVPSDNPFVGIAGARAEIWAWGLRNVWRMSFDRATGALWAGDVGQNRWEEIDRIERGANYGWDRREGAHPFESGPDPGVPLVDPVWEYSHDEGASITGGYVYRGSRLPELAGAYIYADFVSGTLWALRTAPAPANEVLVRQPKNIASFAETADGELYLLAFDGRIYQLEKVTP